MDTASLVAVVCGLCFLAFGAYALVHARGVSRRRGEPMGPSRSDDETILLRRALIQALLANATSQDAGRADEVGQQASFVLAQLSVTRRPVPEAIYTALSFWSGWIDARQHDWTGSAFERREWPILARGIASDLAKNAEIHDEAVLARFAGRRVRPYARMV